MTATNDAVPRTVAGIYARTVSQFAPSARHIALRRKELGIWHELSWRSLNAEVHRLVVEFRDHQIGTGTRVLWTGTLSARLIDAFLALHWLGATVVAVERDVSATHLAQIILDGAVEHALTDDSIALDGLRVLADRDDNPLRYIWFDGVAQHVGGAEEVIALSELLPNHWLSRARSAKQTTLGEPPNNDPGQPAFEFVRERNGQLNTTSLTHDALIEESVLAGADRTLSPYDSLVLEPSLTPDAFAILVYGVWLLKRYVLCIPESASVSLSERKEIGPTYLVGNVSHYANLESWVNDRLPEAGSWKRQFVDWAFEKYAELIDSEGHGERSSARTSLGLLVPAAFAWFTVIRPLRIALGMIRLSDVVLAVSERSHGLPDPGFLSIVSVKPRTWRWHVEAQAGKETVPSAGNVIDLNDKLAGFTQQETVNVVRA